MQPEQDLMSGSNGELVVLEAPNLAADVSAQLVLRVEDEVDLGTDEESIGQEEVDRRADQHRESLRVVLGAVVVPDEHLARIRWSDVHPEVEAPDGEYGADEQSDRVLTRPLIAIASCDVEVGVEHAPPIESAEDEPGNGTKPDVAADGERWFHGPLEQVRVSFAFDFAWKTGGATDHPLDLDAPSLGPFFFLPLLLSGPCLGGKRQERESRASGE